MAKYLGPVAAPVYVQPDDSINPLSNVSANAVPNAGVPFKVTVTPLQTKTLFLCAIT